MNSRLWLRKALSTCLVIATIMTYSMVILASGEKIAGEILITGNSKDGQAPVVKVNGELAQSGRSIFSSSTIATPDNAGAIISLGKVGRIELAPNTTLTLAFNEKTVSGDLSAGRVTVLDAADSMIINTVGGKSSALNAGDSATAANNAQTTDTTSDNNGGSAGLIYAIILGAAVVGIILAARTKNNNISISGGATVVSPTR